MKIHYAKGDEISKGAIISVFVLGACFLGLYLWDLHTIQKTARWPSVEATVIKSELTLTTNLVEGRFGNRVVRKANVDFAFSYAVAGHPYVSIRFFAVGQPSAFFVTDKYPIGRQFTALYNQDSPDEAVVEPGTINYGDLIVSVILL